MHLPTEYLLTFKCPDRLGILAKVTAQLYDGGAFVTESMHYGDPDSRIFFARMVFHTTGESIDSLRQRLLRIGVDLEMTMTLRPLDCRPKVLIAVSKYDHCLNVLLTKWRSNALRVELAGVISNHEICRGLVDWYGIPFHYLPITAATKRQQERSILEIMEQQRVELLVLARYMQILSDDMCHALAGRAINIHHSFLPGFKGARPYHQAHERGVKVIGATAHYVTPELDEGPIIVQEVKPITHHYTVEDMALAGHDTESTALATAVRLHCDGRVFVNGNRTVVL
jgi:formyltetrahydrofolate deformylase